MAGTADELLTSIKLRARLPTNGQPIEDTEILALADEEIRTRLMPAIMRVRENYGVVRQDVTADGSDRYRISDRAVGQKLTSLSTVDSDGKETILNQVHTISMLKGFKGFYVENNSVVVNGVDSGDTLRFRFVARPGNLVLSTDTSKVSRITAVGDGSVTSGSLSGSSFDFVKGTSGFEPVHLGHSVTPSGGVYAVDSDDLEVGDYVCVEGYTPFPQVPLDLHPILAQRVAVTVIEILGYDAELERALRTLERMEADMAPLITPRVDSSPKKIRNNSLLE